MSINVKFPEFNLGPINGSMYFHLGGEEAYLIHSINPDSVTDIYWYIYSAENEEYVPYVCRYNTPIERLLSNVFGEIGRVSACNP